MMEQVRFTYFPSVKHLEIQTKKQVDASKSLNLSNKINEIKQIEIIFQQNQLTGLITGKLKEIKQLKHKIKLDNLKYTTKTGKNYKFW